MEIFAIGAKMFRQMINPGTEKSDLNIAGAGVCIVRLIVADDFSFIDFIFA